MIQHYENFEYIKHIGQTIEIKVSWVADGECFVKFSMELRFGYQTRNLTFYLTYQSIRAYQWKVCVE